MTIEIEALVRRTLHAVADATAVPDPGARYERPAASARRTPVRPLVAAAAAVVMLLAGGLMLGRLADDSVDVASAPNEAPGTWHEIASGSWHGGDWRLLGSRDVDDVSASELTCHRVELNGKEKLTGCGVGPTDLRSGFVSIGPAERSGDQMLLFGELGHDVHRLVIRTPGHEDVVVGTVVDPARAEGDPKGQRFALFALPAGTQAEVEAFDEKGRSLGTAAFSPMSSGVPLQLTRR